MLKNEIESLVSTDPKVAICSLAYQGMVDGIIKPSDLAKVISELYRKVNTPGMERGFDVLDGLDGWCVDDELAINWGIQKLYDRFSKFESKELAKENTINIVEDIIKHFKGEDENG